MLCVAAARSADAQSSSMRAALRAVRRCCVQRLRRQHRRCSGSTSTKKRSICRSTARRPSTSTARLPALNALRGTTFDASPAARVDIAAVRALLHDARRRASCASASRAAATGASSTSGSTSTTSRKLGDAAPFAWSTYQFTRDGDLYMYRQTSAPPAGQGRRRRRLDRRRDRGVPPAPAEQDPLPQHRSATSAAATSWCWEQSLARPAARRSRSSSTRAWTRSRFSTRRCGCSASRSSPSPLAFGVVIWWVMRKGGGKAERADSQTT